MRAANRLILLVLTLGILAVPALAQSTPEVIGEYRAWRALSYKEGGSNVCYMLSSPEKWTSEPKNVRRGDINILVTHNQGRGVKDEVSVYTGYAYKKGSEVTLAIDGQDFELFTDGDSAWARDAKTDRKLVQAMVRGNSMVVRGTSSRGTLTIDTYSLSGFTAARNAINKACKIR
jgi:hypothetical protein